MSFDSQQEQEFTKVMNALTTFGRSMGANNANFSRQPTPRANNRETPEVNAGSSSKQAFKKLAKDLKGVTDTINDVDKGGGIFYNSLIDSAKSLNDFSDETYRTTRNVRRMGILETGVALKRMASKLEKSGNEFADNQRKSSLMLSAMTEQAFDKVFDYDNPEQMYKLLDKLKDRSADFVSKLTNAEEYIFEEEEDVQAIIAKIGQVKANISQVLDGFDLGEAGDNITEVFERVANRTIGINNAPSDQARKETGAIIAAALAAQKSGVNISSDTIDKANANNEDAIKSLAKILKELTDAANKSRDGINDEITARNSLKGQLENQFQKSIMGTVSRMTSLAGITASLAGAFYAFKELLKEAADFNIANISRSFLDVLVTSATQFGISSTEMTKIMTENKELVGLGGKKFEEIFAGTSESLREFGYTSAQMMHLLKPMTDLGVAMRVNITDAEAMSKNSKVLAASHLALSTSMNISMEEYIRSHERLLSSEEYMSAAAGLNNTEMGNFTTALRTSMDHQSRVLGSTDKALNFLVSQQKAKTSTVAERMKSAVNIRLLAKQVGMSDADAAEMSRIHLKGGSATETESKRLEELSKQMGYLSTSKLNEINRGDNRQQEMILRNLIDNVSQNINGGLIAKEGVDENRNKAAGRGQEPTQDAINKAKGNSIFAELNESFNKLTAIFTSSIAVMAGGVIMAGLGATKSGLALNKLAMAAGGAAAALGGSGVGPNIPGGGAPAGGKGGKWGKLGNIAKGGLVGVAAGSLVSAIAPDSVSPWVDVLGGVASGALAGAGVGGPWGAAVGGVIGGGINVLSNKDKLFGKSNSQAVAELNNTESGVDFAKISEPVTKKMDEILKKLETNNVLLVELINKAIPASFFTSSKNSLPASGLMATA